MKGCVHSLCHFVNTHRMVRDYVEGYYMPAHHQFRSLEADNAQRTRRLSQALERIRHAWQEVWIAKVADGPLATVPVSSSMNVRAQVHLGPLSTSDVVVELYVGRVDGDGNLVECEAVEMSPEQELAGSSFQYVVETSIPRSGLHGFTVRARPTHPDMPTEFVPGLICWADQPRAAIAAVQS